MRRKIYFVQPTYRDREGALFKGKSIFIHSLAMPMLSATVPPGWEKDFCIEYFDDINYQTDAPVIGISSMGYDIIHGQEIAEKFKRRGKIVIFGGYQAHFSVERLRGLFDSVVHGNPGPREMAGILRDAETGNLAPEYHCGVHINFPFDYSVFQGRNIRCMPALGSIGCGNNCEFCCTAAVYQGRYYLRKIEYVIADLRAARARGQWMGFVDSNIYANPEYLRRLCAAITSAKLDIHWGAEGTIDIGRDPESLHAMKRAGCEVLFVGLETPNQASLDSVGKPYSAEGQSDAVREIHRAGIAVAGYFLLGLDGDTRETFDQMYRFIRDTRVNLPILNLLLPAPGTRTFARLDHEDRLIVRTEDEFLRNNLSYNISCNRCFYVPKLMSAAETEREFARLHGRLSSVWQVLRRSVTGNLRTFPILLAKNLELRSHGRKMLAAQAAAASLPGSCLPNPASSRDCAALSHRRDRPSTGFRLRFTTRGAWPVPADPTSSAAPRPARARSASGRRWPAPWQPHGP